VHDRPTSTNNTGSIHRTHDGTLPATAPALQPLQNTAVQKRRPTNGSQVRYAAVTIDNAKSARARGSYLRTSFKNTREAAQAINGWKLERALTFLGNVQEKKEAVPMRRYAGSTGRTAQGKWPIPNRTRARRNWDIARNTGESKTWIVDVVFEFV